MNQDINFWKVRDLGEIINATFAFVKYWLRDLFFVLVYTAGPFLLLSAILTIWFQTTLNVPDLDASSDNPFAALSFFTDYRFYLAMIAGMIGSFVLYASMYSFVMLVRDGIEPTVDAVWERIREDAGVFVTTFLLMIGFYIVSIPILIIPCLGIVAWLAALVYLATILQIYVPIRLHERLGTFDAVSRARTLNQGHFADSFLLLVVLIVVTLVLGSIFIIPMMFLSFLYGVNSLGGMNATPLWAAVLQTLFSLLASFLAIVPITATLLHYCNLVERSESPGLSDRIDSWADEQEPDNE